ncbi:MAG: hypothetical protein JW776_03235 [Candidatus Lokiarchaeota archaeon]|nr:hypothetical protein [Candidatus Lokiarchaeota archaeon]
MTMQKALPIDLERSELRYVFYSQDLKALTEDFLSIGFKTHTFPKTPISKTIYFGSKLGVRPGISIKARIYSKHRNDNTVHFAADSLFNILEIKSTLDHDEIYFPGFSDTVPQDQRLISSQDNIRNDIIFRIQRASEDGLLHQSTFKTKSRLRKEDISEELKSNLTLEEIIRLLCVPSNLDERLSSELQNFLNSQIRTLHQKTLVPYLMTQYARTHLIPEKPNYKHTIRITIDPGVEYYGLNFVQPKDFLAHPDIIGEYLDREKFCRLEFKIDPVMIKKEKQLDAQISEILRNYGCLAFISKKWRGTTLVSESYIQNQTLWTEPFGRQISGYFPVNQSWYRYGNITGYLYKLIKTSKNFSLYDEDARMLIKNENYVSGYLGFPIPSMLIRITGPNIQYHLPPKSIPIKTSSPEFYITEEYQYPVRSIMITSVHELNKYLLPSISIDGYAFFRSYGFLVKHNKSERIYKLTIEKNQKTRENNTHSELYCKMRYIGAQNTVNLDVQKGIYEELTEFYNEFAPVMIHPIDIGENELEWMEDELMEFIT